MFVVGVLQCGLIELDLVRPTGGTRPWKGTASQRPSCIQRISICVITAAIG